MTSTDALTDSSRGKAFREMLSACLSPLLFGAEISGPESLRRGFAPAVSHHGPHRLRIALEKRGLEFCTIERKVPFTEEERVFIERVIVSLHEGPHGAALDRKRADSAVEWAIARRVAPEYPATIYEILQIYKEWSAPPAQGTAHSVGVYFSRGAGAGGNFFSLRDEACLKGMGSSGGAVLALGRHGDILAVEKIPPPPTDYRRVRHLAAPMALAGIALWTSRRKAAVRLQPDGDILVFTDKRLFFLRRGACWRGFPHSLAGIDELVPAECRFMIPELRRAVYLSCLDLAFAGRKACIGIVPEDGKGCGAMDPGRLFTSACLSGGGKLMAGLVRGKRYQNLPRVFRLELASMDGPLLLDEQGRILCAGGGFTAWEGAVCPGREAAQDFARSGLGVCIDEKGGLELFGSLYNPALPGKR